MTLNAGVDAGKGERFPYSFLVGWETGAIIVEINIENS